jgi:hypothetical protein
MIYQLNLMKNYIMKKVILLFVFMLGIHLAGEAQKVVKLEIPLTFVNGRPVLEMYVNGKGPFRFIFDTGKMGDQITTDASVASQFNFKVIDSLRMGDPSGQHDVILPVVQIPEVNIGGLKIRNVNAAVNPRVLPGVNGVLGLSFFKDYLVTLDLSHSKITLIQGELPIPDGKTILAYESMMGIPQLKVTIGDLMTDAHIDCGNSRAAVILPQAIADKLKFIKPPVGAGIARTQFNDIEIKEGTIKDTMRIGSYSFEKLVVSFPAFGNAVNLGEQFLSQFIITFDQKNQRMKLIKLPEWKN